MPFDSQGKFNRVHNWEDDRLNDIEIVTDHHDAEDDNFADGLSKTLLRDGTVPMSGNLKMGGFKMTGLAKGTAKDDAVNKEQLDAVSGDFVRKTGDEEISGIKRFSASPEVPTPEDADNSKKAATTAFVRKIIQAEIQNSIKNFVELAMPNYNVKQDIASGFTAPVNGVVVFRFPPRMVGFIQVGAFRQDFNYNYNYTQNTVTTFVVPKGQVVLFSGCTAEFFKTNSGV